MTDDDEAVDPVAVQGNLNDWCGPTVLRKVASRRRYGESGAERDARLQVIDEGTPFTRADGLDPVRDDFGEIAAGDVARAYGTPGDGGSDA